MTDPDIPLAVTTTMNSDAVQILRASYTLQCSQDRMRTPDFPLGLRLPTHPRVEGLNTYLCYLILTPKTGIVQGHIPMLIDCIDVSFVLQQLVPRARQQKRQKTQSQMRRGC